MTWAGRSAGNLGGKCWQLRNAKLQKSKYELNLNNYTSTGKTARKKPQPQAERTNCWHTQLSAEQGRRGQRKASTFSAGDLTEDETTGKSNSLQKEK